jgi:hypothetical protein
MSGEIRVNRPMLSGERVNRVHWVLDTDRLRAVCHCSAEREFDDPVRLWEWLLAHPTGHDTTDSKPSLPQPPPALVASP